MLKYSKETHFLLCLILNIRLNNEKTTYMYYLRNFDSQADAVGQKAYLPTIAIVGGVNKVGYFDGDASKDSVFTENDDFINVGEKETRVVCTYNVTSTTGATQLLYSGLTLSEIASMEIDGVNATVSTGYTFTTTGEHTVKYTLKDNTTISESAFCSTSLTSIVIPDNVTTIGTKAFYSCNNLTSVVIPDNVTTIGKGAFCICSSLTSVTIPTSVTTIGPYAFAGCTSLTSITIPDSVTSIGNNAFAGCTSLTSITIPDSITSIDSFAFSGCSSLTSVTIPDSVTSIGDYAFRDCSGLTSVVIPDNVTSIGEYAFYTCYKLTSVTIGSGVTSIGYNAFSDCTSLTSVTIPDSVTSIGDYAFSHCSGLISITVDTGNTTYDSRDNCNAIIETSTNTLIQGCKNSTIPNSVTSIGYWTFYGCSSLTSVVIPDSVTSIEGYAFEMCTGLTSITYNGTVAQWKAITRGNNWHKNVPSTTTVTCTDGTCELDDK